MDVKKTSIAVKEGLSVSREDRLTLAPASYSHIESVRIQINKNRKRTPTAAPFGYEGQIGLHIYFVPKTMPGVDERETFYDQVADFLRHHFGVALQEKDFILLLNSLYYYTPQILQPSNFQISESWDNFEYYLDELNAVIKTFETLLQNTTFEANSTPHYTEVGVFRLDDFSSRDDLALAGLRAIFNDETSDPDEGFVHRTLFHVKPRHRQIENSLDIEHVPNGLHPKFVVSSLPEKPVDEDIGRCTLYAYFVLDTSIFIDKYQVPDDWKLLVSYGDLDLELPEYATRGWGTESLFEVNSIEDQEITLHSRYQRPNNATAVNVTIPLPMIFYGCEGTSDAYLLKNSPFENRKKFGGSYEKFFTDDSIFYHLGNRGVSTIAIPTASGDEMTASVLTVLALLLGMAIILYLLWRKPQKVKKD